MGKIKPRDHNQILESIIQQIDISDTVHKKASNRYKFIGDWLDRQSSQISSCEPKIYPQGSFRLGTAIKPLSDSDDYDVDLVCELKNPPVGITQKRLKDLVGNEIKGYANQNNLKADQGKRCWTLKYADGQQFHVDILPAIPDRESTKENAILITDASESEWQHSNPIGYANWFRQRQEIQFEKIKRSMMSNVSGRGDLALVETMPDYKIKTPLQKAIQILKRHRDLHFTDKSNKNKPISIIITTLAAHAYNGEDTVVEALRSILPSMKNFIKQKKGTDWVENPVNAEENFADKWENEPEKSKAFFDWLARAERDFGKYFSAPCDKVPPEFEQALGPKIFETISASLLISIIPLGKVLSTPSIVSDNELSPQLTEEISSNSLIKPYGF